MVIAIWDVVNMKTIPTNTKKDLPELPKAGKHDLQYKLMLCKLAQGFAQVKGKNKKIAEQAIFNIYQAIK